MTMERIIRGIQVQHDTLRWLRVNPQKEVHDKVIHVTMSGNDPLVSTILRCSDRC